MSARRRSDGPTVLTVTLDGKSLSVSTLMFTFYDPVSPPTVLLATPSAADTSGGTKVSVWGQNLLPVPAACVFSRRVVGNRLPARQLPSAWS